jgi:pSer/pThr/pTyr-binding forkhead associated (FHA) protein
LPVENFGTLITTLPGGQKREYALSKTEASIGRAATSDIALRDSKVSRAHTRIECRADGCWVVDLGSANGTKLNGVPVDQARLSPGDVISVGATSLRYEPPSDLDENDPELTCIDTEAQLETTLVETAIPNELSETRIPRLAIHSRTRTWEVPLDGDAVTIGRHADNTVVLDSQRASRHHARVEQTAAGFLLHDLGSDNGTWVGGQKITRHKLEDGDTIHIGGIRLLFKAGFSESDLTVVEPRGTIKRPKRPVIVIPGFMGSELFLGSEKVWPDVRQIFKNPHLMKFTEDSPLKPNGLVDEVVIVPNLIKQEQYGRLINYLCEALGYEAGADLLEFAYDFRQDVRISSRQLAQVIHDWNVGPVTLIAHSMGSLVSRYYVDQLGGEKHVERMILLGGPHFGAPKSIVNLAIDPKVLPFGLLGARIRDVLLTYPSAYQLLPEYPCAKDQHGNVVDFLHDPSWLPEQYAPYLKNAAQFRGELKHRAGVPTVCVFGYGLKTLMGVRVERNSSGVCTKVEMTNEEGGDSTVPEPSATLEGTEIHPIRQYHGTLHVDNDVRKRLKIELTR